ncbi:hypothetical protein VCHENC02_2597A, partial [Vibrio harveyi]
MLIYG